MVSLVISALNFILTFGLLIVIVAAILWFGSQEMWAWYKRRRYYRALYRDLIAYAEQEWEEEAR